jgi:hypothetical protein
MALALSAPWSGWSPWGLGMEAYLVFQGSLGNCCGMNDIRVYLYDARGGAIASKSSQLMKFIRCSRRSML